MLRREFLTGAATLAGLAQAQAFGIGKMGAGEGHLGVLGGAQPWSATLSALRAQIIAQQSVQTPHQASAMASPPTLTDLGTTRPSGYTNDFLYTNPALFRVIGSTPINDGTFWRFPSATVTKTGTGGNVGSGKSSYSNRVESDVTSAKFAALIPSAQATPPRILLDGIYVSKSGFVTTLNTGALTWLGIDCTGIGGYLKRRVTIETHLAGKFRGFSCQAGDVVAYPSTQLPAGPASLNGIFFTDSIPITGATLIGDGYAVILSELLGIYCRLASAGSTGYVADNSGGSYNAPNRLIDVNGFGADVIFNQFGVNDLASDTATVQANALTVFQSQRLNNRTAPIFNIGPVDTAAPSTSVAGFDTTEAAILASSAQVPGCYYISLKGVAYTKSDATHPNDAGHLTLANYLYGQIKSILGVA